MIAIISAFNNGRAINEIRQEMRNTEQQINPNVINVENSRVRDYIDNTKYNDLDYSYTNVFNYCSDNLDKPNPGVVSWESVRCDSYEIDVAIDGANYQTTYYLPASECSLAIYNLIPDIPCVANIYKIVSGERIFYQSKVIYPTGRIRMIDVEGVLNVRDIGGYKCGKSKHIKYGLIYRGGALDEKISHATQKGLDTLYTQLGVRTEIDLRSEYNRINSIIGDDCYAYGIAGKSYVAGFDSQDTSRRIFTCIYESVEQGKPVYIHCSGGADRTAFVCCMIEALLGVSEADINIDFELSSFCKIKNTNNYRRYRCMGTDSNLEDRDIRNWGMLLSDIRNYSSGTLSENVYKYFISAGISKADLDHFIMLMTEDD